jgi:hypothetical protein
MDRAYSPEQPAPQLDLSLGRAERSSNRGPVASVSEVRSVCDNGGFTAQTVDARQTTTDDDEARHD